MAFSTKIANIKSKLSKLFFRKDKNYLTALGIGFVVSILVLAFYGLNFFEEGDKYLQALVYQMGYQLPKDPKLVTIVKKDQTSSRLMDTYIDRRDYASLFNFLGQSQNKEVKSKSLNFELFSIKFGLFENIRNQHIIATSYDEWRTFIIDPNIKKDRDKIKPFDQEKWFSASRQVIDYYKKPENKDKKGITSFLKVTGKTWGPKGTNIFKNLSGEREKYLFFPTLCIPWSSEEIKTKVSNIIDFNKDDNTDNVLDDSSKELERILNCWIKFFENLQYSEIVYEFKLFPKFKKDVDYNGSEKSLFTLSIKLKTHARDDSYTVKPSSVIGLDIVLRGDKDKEGDELLENSLNNIKSKVILASYRKTEEINDEGARDADSFKSYIKYNNEVNNSVSLNSIASFTQRGEGRNGSAGRKSIIDNIFIKPKERFLKNKEFVDYAMIDMAKGRKSYVTEAPVIVKVDEKVYDDKHNLIATQTIKPSFALRIALEKIDYDNKYVLPERLIKFEKELVEYEKKQEKIIKDIKIKNKKLSDSDVLHYGKIIDELKKEIPEIKKKLANANPTYVDEQKRVFNEIRKDFCNGKFNGLLKIKDLEIPLSKDGNLCIYYEGTAIKGKHNYAGINSINFYEALDNDSLKYYLKKNPNKTMLNPIIAHRRTMGKKDENKGGRVYIVGTFDSTDFDFYPTPVSHGTPFQISSQDLMGIEIHANVIMNILNRHFLRRANQNLTKVGVIISSFCAAFIIEMFTPLIGGIIALIIGALMFLYSYLSYNVFGQVFELFPLITSIFFVWSVTTLNNYIKQRVKAKSTKEMFSRFVSKDVVQYMLDNPDMVKPGGTKTELTIFFSDVAGFTTISEGLSPEDLVILLNEYLGAMTDLLFEYGGTLDKFIGDAVMAFWNFPRKQEDHAVRAVLCAIAMQKKIKELQLDWAKRGFPKVAARCGINTQDVVVGYMGSQKAQMNFTCMGDGVNLASRLEGANKEYGTMMMVSDNTYQRVKHAVRGRFLDFLAVKGKKEPVKVHELVCKIGDEPEGWFEKTALYDKAIQLHLERKWDEAIATFEEVLKLDPNDGPSKTYITRCNEYKVNPPPEGWDGRYILTHK